MPFGSFHISSLISSSWFVLGDFNMCFRAHEKISLPPARRSCLEFIIAIEDYHLTCLDTKGPFFTWTNNRRGKDRVDIRLDRAFANLYSFQNWNFIECTALARHQSDHNSILLSCNR